MSNLERHRNLEQRHRLGPVVSSMLCSYSQSQSTNCHSEASRALEHINYPNGKVAHKLRFIAVHLHKASKGKVSEVSHTGTVVQGSD